MIGRQTFTVACFSLLVCTCGEMKKLNETENWDTLVALGGTAIGLSAETMTELRNEHYFSDPFSIFLDIKQKLEAEVPLSSILQYLLENLKDGQAVLRRSVAQSCADHLAVADNPSKLPILCCQYSAFPVVASLLEKGLAVDWYLFKQPPADKELLSKLLGSIQSPITNFARVIKQIAEQGGGEAAAAAAEENAEETAETAEAPAEAAAETTEE